MRKTLQEKLGYFFEREDLLTLALTHSSAQDSDADYERLEFLGDRVLGLISAEILYAKFPNEPEGDLSRRHTALVRGETLARAARGLNLGEHLILSAAERQSGGADNDNILSDVMEAIIGAMYLDGGLESARSMLTPFINADLEAMAAPPRDPKTALQEYSQSLKHGLPEYTVLSRTGPDHAPVFVIRVAIPGHAATGEGNSKRAAEKAAANALLAQLEKKS